MADPVETLFEELSNDMNLELIFMACSKSGNWAGFSFYIRKRSAEISISENLVKELESRLRMFFRSLHDGRK